MARKSDQKKPVPDTPGPVPTLSFTFLRVFSVAASGSVGIVAGTVLSILGMGAVVALLFISKRFGTTLSEIVKHLSPWLLPV